MEYGQSGILILDTAVGNELQNVDVIIESSSTSIVQCPLRASNSGSNRFVVEFGRQRLKMHGQQ